MIKENQLVDCLNKKTLGRQDILLVILSVDVDDPKKVKVIKHLGRNAGLPEILKWNISEILRRSKRLAIHLPEGWILTSKGKEHINLLGVLNTSKSPKVIHQEKQLRAEISKLKNPDTKAFLEEALCAFEIGLYRACVVLSWVGAMSLLYDHVMQNCLLTFNIEAKGRNSNWKNAKIKDDLARMKESEFLNIIGSPPISIIGKSLKEELKNNCLKLRNDCGHPNSLKIGENKVAAHLEILILNIFTKFS